MNQSSKVNPLLHCFEELFAVMAEVQDNFTNEEYDINLLRDQVKSALHRFEVNALEQLIDNEKIYKSKFALTAFLDEWIIRSASGRASTWLSHPLQLELFNVSHAGEQFFQHLSTMRLQAEKYIDVLEIYYLCLDLGYQGHFRFTDKADLPQLRYELLTQIIQVKKVKDLKLSEDMTKSETVSPVKPQNYLKHVAMAAGISILVVTVSLWITVSVKASSYHKNIANHQHQLMTKYRL